VNDPRPIPAAVPADEVARRVQAVVRPEILAERAYRVPDTDGLVLMHANENPHPLPPALRERLARAAAAVPLNRYPDGGGAAVKAALARALPLPPGAAMALGNGSDELIQILTTVVAQSGAAVLAPDPTFVMYRVYALHAGVRYVPVPLRDDLEVDEPALIEAIARERPALVWLASPNNPTGRAVPVAAVERILAAAPGVVAVDEAYADFGGVSLLPRVLEFPNLVVLRTLSKVGLAGARLGYAAGHPAWIGEIDKVRSPYNVNALTQAVVPVLLEAGDVLAAQAAAVCEERGRLAAALAAVPGFSVTPSDANFLLVRVPDAERVAADLRAGGVLVKSLHGHHPLTANCLRITVGTPAENETLLRVLAARP
jgi:histidinol-phosphate aminotransferase